MTTSHSANGPDSGNPAWTVRDPRGHRRGRNGRSLPRARHEVESRRRDQGAPRGVYRERRASAAVHAGGAASGPASPSEHRDGVRPRGVERRASARDGVHRRPRPLGAHRGWADPARGGVADRETDRRGARSGARARDRPPRPQAGQRQGQPRRNRQGARLRVGEGAGSDWASRRRQLADNHGARHTARDDSRFGRLYGPRAGAREGGRSPRRYLGLRRRPLRNAGRPANLRGRCDLGRARCRAAPGRSTGARCPPARHQGCGGC